MGGIVTSGPSSPCVRRPGRASCLAALLLALLVVAVPAGQTGAIIVFDSPIDNGYASGPTSIRLRVLPPGIEVQGVTITADGRKVCSLDRPPFECAWNAGPAVTEHVIRASVVLPDGRRIAQTITTRGEEYVESVEVDVVRVTATVTDERGEFVRGLRREDFRIYEDNVPQRISAFLSENIPLEIVVAMDVSGSMRPSMPVVKQAVKKFLRALRPEDRVTLLTVNDNVFTLARPSVTLEARLKAVDRMNAWGGTALYDAIVKSVDQLGRETGRRALVVFTDGEDLNSRVPLETAERRLETSDVLVYAIGQGRAPRMTSLKEVLERLARKSGGKAFFEDVEGLDEVFRRIIEDLSNQYFLCYPRRDSAKDSRWRKLRVEVPGRNVRVRAREGYRVVAK
jgi:Ca-activated chloride channel homolog